MHEFGSRLFQGDVAGSLGWRIQQAVRGDRILPWWWDVQTEGLALVSVVVVVECIAAVVLAFSD